MSIDFGPNRWDGIKKNSRQWWAGDLERPLIQMNLNGRDPERNEPKLPMMGFTCFYSLDTPAEEIVDVWDYQLSSTEFLGDAFPSVWPNFGPGVIAALMGAELWTDENTTWFLPLEEREISDMHFEYDSDNIWLNRIKDIYEVAVTRWNGRVQVSMTDLGGNLDILSTFRPSEKLLLDLYDFPDEVKRLTWEAHEMWFRYFGELNEIIQSKNHGYTAWAPIFSETPYYILQSDFCFMIGPDMFDEFVKPELAATCKRLDNPFYHLDGPGQLPHLDSLLEIEELKGVQWVPGDGQPGITEWPEVYRKIREAGKLIQISSGQSELGYKAHDVIADQLGDASGIVMIADCEIDEKDEVLSFLDKYGALT